METLQWDIKSHNEKDYGKRNEISVREGKEGYWRSGQYVDGGVWYETQIPKT